MGVGNINYEALIEKVSQLCSCWKPYQADHRTPPAPPGPRQKTITDKKVAREHIALMSAAPEHREADRYAAGLLAAILGDVTGSRLYYALIEPAIADEASTGYEPMDGAGGFLTFISTDAERAEEALRIARSQMRELIEVAPTEAELIAAKNKIASAATLKGELPMGRLKPVWTDWVYRNQYIPLTEQIETLLAVTSQEVLELARRYDLSATTVAALGPLESL